MSLIHWRGGATGELDDTAGDWSAGADFDEAAATELVAAKKPKREVEDTEEVEESKASKGAGAIISDAAAPQAECP